MNPQIVVSSVSKAYKIHIRDDGFFGALKSVIRRKYERIPAVNNITFKVDRAEILGLIGLNGAGKTTMIKMASGIMKPDSGSVRVLGEDPFRRRQAYRRNVALVMGQKGQLDPDLSILDCVSLYARIYDVSKPTAIGRAKEMAGALGLIDVDLRKQVRSLSLGQRMKGELILAFIHMPRIVFLDEPTLGLDFVTQKAIRGYIKSYKERQRASIILTSHDMDDIEELCDRILIMRRGNVIFEGPIQALRRITPYYRKVTFETQRDAAERIQKSLNIPVRQITQGRFDLTFAPIETARVIRAVTDVGMVKEFSINEDTLDMLIEALYEGNQCEAD